MESANKFVLTNDIAKRQINQFLELIFWINATRMLWLVVIPDTLFWFEIIINQFWGILGHRFRLSGYRLTLNSIDLFITIVIVSISFPFSKPLHTNYMVNLIFFFRNHTGWFDHLLNFECLLPPGCHIFVFNNGIRIILIFNRRNTILLISLSKNLFCFDPFCKKLELSLILLKKFVKIKLLWIRWFFIALILRFGYEFCRVIIIYTELCYRC